MLTSLKVPSLACKCASGRPEHNARGGIHGNKFGRYWNPKMKYTNGYSSKSRWKKWGHLSSYHVYSWSYVKNDSFFVSSADGSNKSVSLDKIFKFIKKY